jgi:hypothetical protein
MTAAKQLLSDYNALEDRAEDAASKELWDLAWWLAANVKPAQGERTDLGSEDQKLTISKLAAQGRRGARWLGRLRKLGTAWTDSPVPGKSPREHIAALEAAKWDLDRARAALVESKATVADKASPDALDPRNTQAETHAAVLMLRASLKTLPDDDEQIAQLEKSLASARRVIDQAEKKLAQLKAKRPNAGRAVAS